MINHRKEIPLTGEHSANDPVRPDLLGYHGDTPSLKIPHPCDKRREPQPDKSRGMK